MSNDNFKKSPLHDKKEIIRMMDELEPKHMAEIVEHIVKLHNETYGGNNHLCCTPEGQIKRYVNCIGCDRNH